MNDSHRYLISTFVPYMGWSMRPRNPVKGYWYMLPWEGVEYNPATGQPVKPTELKVVKS